MSLYRLTVSLRHLSYCIAKMDICSKDLRIVTVMVWIRMHTVRDGDDSTEMAVKRRRTLVERLFHLSSFSVISISNPLQNNAFCEQVI